MEKEQRRRYSTKQLVTIISVIIMLVVVLGYAIYQLGYAAGQTEGEGAAAQVEQVEGNQQ